MKIVITAINKGAKKLAKKLINSKIAACVSIVKAGSIYSWQGVVCDEKEKILLIKTDNKFKKVAKFIEKNHSYDLPEILKIRAKSTKKYKKWIKKESK